MENPKRTVRNALKTLQVGTIGTELNSATKNTYLSESARIMNDATQIGDLMQKTRTMNGTTYPNTGAISNTVLTDDTAVNIQPATGECWRILSIIASNNDGAQASTITLSFTDGSTVANWYSSSTAAGATVQFGLAVDDKSPLNMPLTSELYLRVSQDGNAAAVTVTVIYVKDVI
jgi:hypothetical protein